MIVSILEKLVQILHKHEISIDEFVQKFENIESQDASTVENQLKIDFPVNSTTWQPYKLFFDSIINVSSSHLGNGVYQYYNPAGVYPELTCSNPITSTKGSLIFWVSSSVDNGTFTLVNPIQDNLNPQLSVSPYLDGIAFTLQGSNNVVTPLQPKIPFDQWGLVVVTQNEVEHKIYQQGQLIYTGTVGNLTGSLSFFLYDYNVANIAFTNKELNFTEVTNLFEGEVTANYKDILGYTPEAYWRGAPISGTTYYVPNEVF